MRLLVLSALSTLLAVLLSVGEAAALTWTGEGDNQTWEDPANWGSDRYPGDGTTDDDATIAAIPGKTPWRARLGTNITLATLNLGRGMRLVGGRITVSTLATWTDGELGTEIVLPSGARMLIEGSTEKRLTRQTTQAQLALIENSGELLIGGPGRLHMLFDARIANTGRVVLHDQANLMGNRCCAGPSSGIVGPGELVVERGLLPLLGGADLANLMLETDGPIRITPDATLFLSGGSHKLADGIRVEGGGQLILRHAAAAAARIDLTAGTMLKITDRSQLNGDIVLTGPGAYRWTGGQVTGSLEVAANTGLMLAGGEQKAVENPPTGRRGQLRNLGRIEVMDVGRLWLGGGPAGGVRFDNRGVLVLAGTADLVARSCCADPSVLANAGRVEKTGSEETELRGIFLDNAGKVDIQGGRLLFSAQAEFGQKAGETLLAPGTTIEARRVRIAGGELRGAGTIKGLLENLAGELVPGPGPATLRIEGDFTQFRDGILRLELGGLAAGIESDLLEVSGAARLDGERRVLAMPGFQPTVGERVEVLRYIKRQGVFARVPGLDLAAGRHLQASYEEPGGLGTAGSLWLRVAAEALPAECRAPQRQLAWADDNDDIARILSQSHSAAALVNGLAGRYDVLTTEPPPPELGRTGRSNQSPDDRGRVGFQFAWSRLASLFQWASIFNHEAGHAQQALQQRFVSSEAAPFMTARDYAVLRWSGEEGAYRVQATGLDEIADAKPDFERCRAEILADDSRVERMSAGRPEEARKEIAVLVEYPLLETEWRRHGNITAAERAKLADVETRVKPLLATPAWKAEVARWQNRLPP